MENHITKPTLFVAYLILLGILVILLKSPDNECQAPNTNLDGLAVRVVHLDERRVAGVDGHADADERLEAVGVGRALGAHHEAEGAGRRVDVERVLHGALLPPQEHHVERRVAGRRYHLRRREERRGGI